MIIGICILKSLFELTKEFWKESRLNKIKTNIQFFLYSFVLTKMKITKFQINQ